MSVNIPQFSPESRTADEGDIFPYGFAFTSFELDDAVMSLNDLLPDLIKLAEIEKSCELMSAEIEKTRRRVNSLEHVMIPRYQETIKYIAMKLEENDRSSRTRLMKVKDMLLEKTYHYSSKQ
jgi:V/A-type H+-transporting ATPase subunit D